MISGIIRLKNIFLKVNVLLFFSLFIFSFQVRGIVLKGNAKNFNIIATISIIYILIRTLKNTNKYMILIVITCILNVLISQIYNNKAIIENIVVISCIILPLFLVISNINNEVIVQIFDKYIKVFNVIIIIMIVIGIIDNLTANSLGKIIASIINDSIYYELVSNPTYNRYYSFMGHPLYNTQLFLMFYLINLISNKYFKKGMNMNYVIVLTIIGLSLTASKTGIILLGVTLLFTSPLKNKWIYYTYICVFLIILFKLGVFDTVLDRFTYGTLTSGRNEVWEIIKNNNFIPFKFLNGYGSGYNNQINYFVQTGSAAYEYPIRLFALEYGILNTLLIYLTIFVYPFLCLLKNRHYIILMAFLIVFVDVNTYNGIGLGMDIMLMFCVYVYILLNISNYIKSSNINEKRGKNEKI